MDLVFIIICHYEFCLIYLSSCLSFVPAPQPTAAHRHPPPPSPSHPFLLPPSSCPSSIPTLNQELDLGVLGSILTEGPTFITHCQSGLPKTLGEVRNDSRRNKGVLHTPFALPLLLLLSVTFLAGVAMEAWALGGLTVLNTLRSSFWLGCIFQFGVMSSFVEVAAVVPVVAGFWRLEIRVLLFTASFVAYGPKFVWVSLCGWGCSFFFWACFLGLGFFFMFALLCRTLCFV